MNSLNCCPTPWEEKIIIDKEYYYTKEEQCGEGIDVGEKSGVGEKRMGKMERVGENKQRNRTRVEE